jgi:hypothetical protein
MKSTSKAMLLAAVVAAVLGVALVSSQQLALAGQNAGMNNDKEQNVASDAAIPLKEAKLNIEHNAKDNDTGFQGAIDSEGWDRITATTNNLFPP